MKNKIIAKATAVALTVFVPGIAIAGGPVDDELVIDGDINMITRAAPPEGHQDRRRVGWGGRGVGGGEVD